MSNPQLPFGLQADQLKAGAVRNMTSDKLATFSVGGMKKTPFQKHKAALAAKRREQEAQAAAELAKWEEDCDSSAADRPKQFVKGETIQQGQAGGSSSRQVSERRRVAAENLARAETEAVKAASRWRRLRTCTKA